MRSGEGRGPESGSHHRLATSCIVSFMLCSVAITTSGQTPSGQAGKSLPPSDQKSKDQTPDGQIPREKPSGDQTSKEKPDESPRLPEALPPTYPPASEYRLDDACTKLTFLYGTKRFPGGGFEVYDGRSAGEKLVIKWSSPKGIAPRRIKVILKFTYGKNKVEVKIPISDHPPIEGDGNGQYVIHKVKLDEIAKTLVDKINQMAAGFDADHPILIPDPVEVTVIPDDAGGAYMVQPVKTPNTIQVIMKQVA